MFSNVLAEVADKGSTGGALIEVRVDVVGFPRYDTNGFFYPLQCTGTFAR
jgi:hypothetical protein